jgi:hypothetical protein
MADRTYTNLAELRERLPRLDSALPGGTPRRWSQRDLTPAERERHDVQARLDKAARDWNARHGIGAIGASRAPLSVAVLDAKTAINKGIAAIEATVCEWLGLTPLAGATTRERITRIIGLLARIEALDELAAWVDAEAAHLNRQARSVLGDSEPVHRINARCPICDALSLRAFPEREVVICVNDDCRCADDDCRCHADRPRRHRWVYAEWPWLAQLLDRELENAAS